MTRKPPRPLKPSSPKTEPRDRRRIFSGVTGGAGLLDELGAVTGGEWSRSDLRRALASGLVQVAGKPVQDSGACPKGAVVRVDLRQGVHGGMGDAPAVKAGASRNRMRILERTPAFVVIWKPAGMLSQPVEGSRRDHVPAALRAEFVRQGRPADKPIRLVHRLDEGTEGLMVVAIGDNACRRLKAQFEQGRAQRLYLAWVEGVPPVAEGRVDAPIGRPGPGQLRKAGLAGGKPAVTRFRVVHRDRSRSLVLCQLLTGRTHQVRLHMAHLGCPVAGDPLYGRGKDGGPMLLLSAGLALLDPAGKPRHWTCMPGPGWPPLPAGALKSIESLLASLLDGAR